jgi:dynein heavy chain, axonemal
MFKEAINEASTDKDLVDVSTLLDAITKQLYSSICNGLFERHKLIYSFLICSSIKREAKEINETHWSLILRGAGIFNKTD